MKKGSSHHSLIAAVFLATLVFSPFTAAQAGTQVLPGDDLDLDISSAPCNQLCESTLREDIDMAEKARSVRVLPDLYNRLGKLTYSREEFVEAEEWFGRAVKVSAHCDDSLNEALSYLNLGMVQRKMGEKSEARNMFRNAMRLTRGTKAHALRVNALFQYGRILKQQKNMVWAKRALVKAKGLSRKYALRRLYRVSARELSSFTVAKRRQVQHIKRVRVRTSVPAKKIAQKVATRVVNKVQVVKPMQQSGWMMRDKEMAASYDKLGASHMERRQYDMASEMFRKSIFMNGQLKNTVAQAKGYENLAKIYVKLGDHKNSCVNLWQARELMVKTDKKEFVSGLTKQLQSNNCLLQQAALNNSH